MVPMRAPTLGNIVPSGRRIVPQKTTWLRQLGFYKCGLPRCGVCRFCRRCTHFTDSESRDNFSIRSTLNCSSNMVIYIIVCTSCNIFYVGSTIRPLKVRIGEHVSGCSPDHSSRSRSMASQHFCFTHRGDVSHFSFFAIEQVQGSDAIHRLRVRECFWMHRLRSFQPLGMNKKDDIFIQY